MPALPEPWDQIVTVALWALSGIVAGFFARSKLPAAAGGAPSPAAGDALQQIRRELLYVLTMTAGGGGPPFAPDRPDDAQGGPLAGSLLRLATTILSDASKPVEASLAELKPIVALHRDLAGGPGALLGAKGGK